MSTPATYDPGSGDAHRESVRNVAWPTARETPPASQVSAAMPRDASIDACRGVALLLVLTLHVSTDPLLAASMPLTIINLLTQHLRLPLFTLVAGYAFARRPLALTQAPAFVRGKARRLLLPMLAVGVLEFVAKSIVPTSTRPQHLREVWQVAILPYQHFWYLGVLFVLFLIAAPVRLAGGFETRRRWAMILMITTVIAMVPLGSALTSSWFTHETVMALAPYFVAGIGAARWYPRLPTLSARVAGGVTCLSVAAMLAAWATGHLPLVAKNTPFGVISG